MSGTRKPAAWLVQCEGQSHIYKTKAEAMWWGKFMASYSTTTVKVSPLHSGHAKELTPRTKTKRKPTKVWIKKVLW